MRPSVSRKATSSSPRSLTRTGGQSGSGSSQASSAGIQYRRIVVPIGVPAPIRVMSSFSSWVSMGWPPRRTRLARDYSAALLLQSRQRDAAHERALEEQEDDGRGDHGDDGDG